MIRVNPGVNALPPYLFSWMPAMTNIIFTPCAAEVTHRLLIERSGTQTFLFIRNIRYTVSDGDILPAATRGQSGYSENGRPGGVGKLPRASYTHKLRPAGMALGHPKDTFS